MGKLFSGIFTSIICLLIGVMIFKNAVAIILMILGFIIGFRQSTADAYSKFWHWGKEERARNALKAENPEPKKKGFWGEWYGAAHAANEARNEKERAEAEHLRMIEKEAEATERGKHHIQQKYGYKNSDGTYIHSNNSLGIKDPDELTKDYRDRQERHKTEFKQKTSDMHNFLNGKKEHP